MLHSLKPEDFVLPQYLQTPWGCPECGRHFVCGEGVMSLTHYRHGSTRKLRHGLACFCSIPCLLQWEHPAMLGLMQ
jgi:hypothetical protein